MTHRCALWICVWLMMAGCTEELGVTSAAVIVPDDETKLACPSGPHELAGRGSWKWGNVDVDIGPYDDADTARREGTKDCNARAADAVTRTDEAAIRECKEDIARVGCGLGAEDKPCDLKSTPIKDCEVTDRTGGTPDIGAPKNISDKYFVSCRYNPTARARGKIKASCELRG
jgi:hypothetical protein